MEVFTIWFFRIELRVALQGRTFSLASRMEQVVQEIRVPGDIQNVKFQIMKNALIGAFEIRNTFGAKGNY